MDVIARVLREKFSKKKSVLDANFRAIKLGYDYAKEHYDCPLPSTRAMNETKDSILLDGNSAGARRRVRRRDGRRVVSDHAVDVPDGGIQEYSERSASLRKPNTATMR
jgi:hypothetical protein